ncbi:transcriptional regulator [Pasteurellaceae bacterium Macca]|nr:transcriptional regulator [Pasteurellaceae bacterium Macca]
MKILNEKQKFSQRLNLALNSAYPNKLKTSDIATKFNLQHHNEPVTPQAVYKWVNGLSILSDDKVNTLAKWLKVKPEWLRYGVQEGEQPQSELDKRLVELVLSLSDEKKKLLVNWISLFELERER